MHDIVDMNRLERSLGERPADAVPRFLRSNPAPDSALGPEVFAPPAREVPMAMPTMSDAAKRHTTDLDRRVAAWLEQRVAMSDEIREGIETADNMRRIYLALQAELDSAHVAAVTEPEADGAA